MVTPLTWLRSFDAAARRGSFTTAADELGMTQAAVSQQIKALEQRLGTQLFQREPRGVSLTGAGSELFREVSAGLEHVDAALARFGRRDKNQLTIVSNASLAVRWLQPRLPQFMKSHPEVTISLRLTLWRTDALGLNADVELFHGPTGQTEGAMRLQGGEMCGLAAERTAAAFKSGKAIAPVRFIRATGYEKMYDTWQAHCLPKSTAKLPPIECDTYQAAVTFAESDLGVTIAPKLVAADSLDAGRLMQIALPDAIPATAYWYAIRDRAPVVAMAFGNWLAQECQRSAM